MPTVSVHCLSPAFAEAASRVALALATQVQPQFANNLLDDQLALVFGADDVCLYAATATGFKPLRVDFVGGKLGYRHSQAEPKSLLAKAVGLKPGIIPTVWDATAGLGQDSFILAKHGCSVQMYERNAVVYALLADGLRRVRDAALAQVDRDGAASTYSLLQTANNLQLEWGSLPAVELLKKTLPLEISAAGLPLPQVIYLDPMFPERTKSAKVNKGMQIFHELVGGDEDAADLLAQALAIATHRVVVKRPKQAPILGSRAPSVQLTGKTLRFDVYTLKKLERNGG